MYYQILLGVLLSLLYYYILSSRKTIIINENKCVYENSLNIEEVLYNARMTAESNSYESQYLQWLEFMRGFVELR